MSGDNVASMVSEHLTVERKKVELQGNTKCKNLSKQQKQRNVSKKYQRIFHIYFGHEFVHFTSFDNFVNWLYTPVDGTALGIFRMLYGAAMLIDIAEERGGGQLDLRFGEPQHCHFPLLHFLDAFSFPIMCCIYFIMWLGAMGIMLGYLFQLSCLAFCIPYWYIFLLDKPAWNNHSYLFGLVGAIFLFTQANRCCSLDKYFNQDMPTTVPYWNYFIIKFQFFLLYFYAGLKKLTVEWLSGYAMSSLSEHWIFTPFRFVLSMDMIDLLIVHWLTAVFDFFIPFLMSFKRTRYWATSFMITFHLINTRLFSIGMFPWVCLAEVPLFFGFNWPNLLKQNYIKKWNQISYKINQLMIKIYSKPFANGSVTELSKSDVSETKVIDKSGQENILDKHEKLLKNHGKQNKPITCKQKCTSSLILGYCFIQLFLPYSHFITKGYNNWTQGLYGYSWDMMVHTYNSILTSIKIVDNNNGEIHYLNPYAFTEYERWTKHADMAWQYARCIKRNIENEFGKVIDPAEAPISSTNISIYFDIWCSMNGRFQQRIFDPRVDILRAEWSHFQQTKWTLPLLNELNHMRPELHRISMDVYNWSNFSDVVFVADFPGLTLDNYISTDLINATLTILEGKVRYRSANDTESYFLEAGKSLRLPTGIMHYITTLGSRPSCYIYTYVNKTMLDTDHILIEEEFEGMPLLPLWDEFKDRIDNYKRFLIFILNNFLYLLYKVPILLGIRVTL